jgi:hypothetical protein
LNVSAGASEARGVEPEPELSTIPTQKGIQKMTDFSAVRGQIADIDPGDAIARLADVDKQSRELEAAIERGQSDDRRLTERIRTAQSPSHRLEALADQLLKGGDVDSVATTVADLESRQRALREAIRGLERRRSDLRASRDQIRHDLRAQFRAAGEVAFPDMAEEAQALVQRLATVYANARTLALISSEPGLTRLSKRLGRVLTYALERDHESDPVLLSRQPIEVEQSLIDALEVGREALDVAKVGFAPMVPSPDDPDRDAFNAGLRTGLQSAAA